jgi:hypothetical protein
MLAEPSLQDVCIWRSPRSRSVQSGLEARRRRASASARKSRRIAGGFTFSESGFSIHLRNCSAMNGPTPCNSVSGRPAATRSAARSGQRKALRDARRNARTRIPELVSAFRANNSARSEFDGLTEAITSYCLDAGQSDQLPKRIGPIHWKGLGYSPRESDSPAGMVAALRIRASLEVTH